MKNPLTKKKRSKAAKKGWETRRTKKKARSEQGKKAADARWKKKRRKK